MLECHALPKEVHSKPLERPYIRPLRCEVNRRPGVGWQRVELDYHGKQGSIVNFNFGHLMLNHAGIVSTCTLTLFSSSISSPTSFFSLFTNLSYTASVRKKKEVLLSYIKALLLRYIKTQTFSANYHETGVEPATLWTYSETLQLLGLLQGLRWQSEDYVRTTYRVSSIIVKLQIYNPLTWSYILRTFDSIAWSWELLWDSRSFSKPRNNN